MIIRPVHPATLLAAISVLVCALLWPGTRGDFLFDDSINITDNGALKLTSLRADYLIEAAFSNPAGAGQRWLSMLSFALNQYFLGPDAVAYKAVNIVIHALTAAALFAFLASLSVVQRHTRPGKNPSWFLYMALVTTLWWAISPINLSPALYIVQRMTSLCALFAWLCLACWLHFRLNLDRSEHLRASMWLTLSAGAAVLSVSSKENGALIPLYLLLVEVVLLRPTLNNQTQGTLFTRLLAGLILLAVVTTTAWLLLRPDWLTNSYALREFSPAERIMTQGRVLWFYFWQTILPQNRLLGLYHDDLAASTGILSPPTTLLAWLGWGAFVWTAVSLRNRNPIACFGMLLFLAGHAMEASFLSLELIHEHRNYLPSGGLIMAMVGILGWLGTKCPAKNSLLLMVAGALYLFFIAAVLITRVQTWSDPETHALVEAHNHPNSPRSQYQLARMELKAWEKTGDNRLVRQAHDRLKVVVDHLPNNSDALIGLLAISSRHPEFSTEADHWRTKFITQLDSAKLHPSLVGKLSVFLESCAQSFECIGNIDKFTSSFLNNTHASPRFKALWLVSMANFRFERKEFSATESLLRKAVEIDPKGKDIQRILGIFYLQNGKLDEAKSTLSPLSRGLFGWSNPSIDFYLGSIEYLRKHQEKP